MRRKTNECGKWEEIMKNTWKKAAGLLCMGILLLSMTGCAKKKEPVSLTVWTYYNGEQLGAFNEASG